MSDAAKVQDACRPCPPLGSYLSVQLAVTDRGFGPWREGLITLWPLFVIHAQQRSMPRRDRDYFGTSAQPQAVESRFQAGAIRQLVPGPLVSGWGRVMPVVPLLVPGVQCSARVMEPGPSGS